MFKLKKEFFPLNETSPAVGEKSNISELLKEATQIKNKGGFETAIIFLKSLIPNFNYSEKDVIRVIKRIVDYNSKIKGGLIDEQISYLNNFLKDKDIYNDNYIELHCIYSTLLFKKDKSLGIDYLSQLLKNNDFTEYSFVKFYTELALKYKNNNNFVEALNTYKELINKLNINEAFQYQRNYCEITFEISELYYDLKPQKWEFEFIKCRISNFVYLIITDIDINIMSGFFYRKDICYKGEWGEDEKLNDVITLLDKNNNIKEIYKKVFDFTFLELPIIMGLPKECLNEEGHTKFRDNPNFVYDCMKFNNVVNSNGTTMFDSDGFEILKPFTQFETIENRIQEITNEIIK
jgi:hypothetical protein